mmetsp:Transcript_23997/g.55396  ORF Transcript_23997/g.55396 Transcript_23997/m.55396 type:complete len:292 (+) Transcript_23997:45-920(+)|eukprot:593222-Amphidinium_carterae.1
MPAMQSAQTLQADCCMLFLGHLFRLACSRLHRHAPADAFHAKIPKMKEVTKVDNGKRFHCFISHAYEDGGHCVAIMVTELLQKHGFSVVWNKAIPDGVQADQEEALDRSDCVLVFVTPEYRAKLMKPDSICYKEMHKAITQNKWILFLMTDSAPRAPGRTWHEKLANGALKKTTFLEWSDLRACGECDIERSKEFIELADTLESLEKKSRDDGSSPLVSISSLQSQINDLEGRINGLVTAAFRQTTCSGQVPQLREMISDLESRINELDQVEQHRGKQDSRRRPRVMPLRL